MNCRKKYEKGQERKSLRKTGCRLLTAALAVTICLSCPVAQAQEKIEQRLQEAVERKGRAEVNQQAQANQQLQEVMQQASRQTQADDYTDAIMLSPVMNTETGEWDSSWGLTCSAISYEGCTYVFTAGDYDDFDYEKYLRITGNADSNTDILMASLGTGLAVCYGFSPIEGQPAAPLGELDPEARLSAGFFIFDQNEEKYSMVNGWIAGSLERTEGGYIIDEDFGIGEMWNGALVVDSQTGEAVGIGGYRDGQYLVYDILIDVVKDVFAVERWGEYAGEIETEADEPETSAKEEPEAAAAEESKEEETEEKEPEAAAAEEPKEEETGEKEPEAAAAEEPKEKETETPETEAPVREEPEEGKPSGWTETLPPGAWIAILTGVLVVIFLAGNRKKKGASPDRPEKDRPEKSVSPYSEKSEYTPPSGTILLGPEQRQSQYILECVSGPAAGKQLVIFDSFSIGRDPQNSDLALPEDTKGVSRRHCRIEIRDGRILLRDLDSSYGTFLENGVKLEAQTPYSIDPGMVFYTGSRQVSFRVIKR